jgi:dTDP-4-dehydrorhamnose reductase
MTNKQSILATGLSGLVGSRIALDLAEQFAFTSLDISNPISPVDITDEKSVQRAFSSQPDAKYVLHLAAFTDVTAAWQQQGDKNGLAYRVNVLGTENIVKACQETGKHLIHISTAYVFDGKKTDLYTEADQINPIEWYGQTKAEAEEVVQASPINWTILRIDQPFRSDPFVKPDVVRRIANGLEKKTLPPQFTDHYFGPTFIDDLSKVVAWIAKTNTTGLFHTTTGEKWTDYDFARLIASKLDPIIQIQPGSLEKYLATSNRPYQANTAMANDKLAAKLDFSLKSVAQAVEQLTWNDEPAPVATP